MLPNPSNNLEITLPELKPNIKNSIPEKIPLSTKVKDDGKPVGRNGTSNHDVPVMQGYFSYLKDEQPLLISVYNSLKVNKSLSAKPHEEIIKYRKKENNDYPYYNREAKLKIKSSSGVIIPEILPFIDSLFKALEKVGAKINITSDETQVLYRDYVFILIFRLPSKRVNLLPDDKEYSSYNTFKYVSTGKINVEVGYRLGTSKWLRGERLIKQNKADTVDTLLKKVFLYIFSLPEKVDEDIKEREIEKELRRQEEEKRAIIEERHNREYRHTEELLQKSIDYFYSKIVKEYVKAEIDESTDLYKWAMDKADWIKDSEKNPDEILTIEDKWKLINPKNERNFFLY